jgi:uncharacterized membrane protein
MDVPVPQTAQPAPSEGMVVLTHVLYGMHGFSALMGLMGTVFVVTAFLTGWPSIIAVIINYVKRGSARGTWLDSHYGWQLRTFWYAVLWVAIAGVLFVTVIGAPFAWALLVVVGIWVIYRLIRGWIALANGRGVPVPG